MPSYNQWHIDVICKTNLIYIINMNTWLIYKYISSCKYFEWMNVWIMSNSFELIITVIFMSIIFLKKLTIIVSILPKFC